MLTVFDGLREVSMLSVALRMVLAAVCGGCIGLEREYKRRPAGFRTHILICLGAAIATATGEFLYQVMGYNTDISRMGAQVVAGIGFIGAGCIMVTRRRRVKGLTTAAGLWAAAVIGLCLGAGFFEGGIFATVLVLAAELVFSKWEYHILENSAEINLLMEYSEKESLDAVLELLRQMEVKIQNMVITRSPESEKKTANVIFTLQMNKKHSSEAILAAIGAVEGVLSVEEL